LRIIVASSIVPFIHGGGRMIVDDLVRELRARDHEVDEVLLPHWSHPDQFVDQLVAYRLLDLTHVGDRLITIRNPVQVLRHPNKVAWFIHHQREAYDLWGTPYQGVPNTPQGRATRDAIISADNSSLREMRRIFTNSNIVSARLARYNQVASEVLYPPLGNPEGYRCDGYGDYIFYVSRFTPIKRQVLLVNAMSCVRSGVRLVLAGAPDTPGGLHELEAIVKAQQLEEKVEIIGGWVSEDEKRDLFARCLAAAYVPYDEDSYGYPTLEAFHSSKAVITCTDSGGTQEIIHDGVNGLIVVPTAESLARAMDALYEDRERAQRLGEAGRQTLADASIHWDHVVARLLS
jgi:glycosyltransferase involved in cell wall biosynthesis